VPFACGHHRALIYERGGINYVGELTPLEAIRWNRKRDDISDSEATIGTTECCDLLGDLRTIIHELHIERDGVVVWQGPITRIEYEWNQVRVYAADMLWQATRTVLTAGYDQSYPNIYNVIDRMHWLLRDQCFLRHGDPWNMVAHLHPMHHPGDPKTSRKVNRYQYYVWEDFDKYAEDMGADYTVVNRDIYYWDINLQWKVIPPLDEQYLSQFPRIVEYGNQAATQGYVTNGEGYAGIATADLEATDLYGWVDWLVTNQSDGTEGAPTAEEIAGWADSAARNIDERSPAPVAIVIPANTTLLPGAPWVIDDLVPGAWFDVDITRMCRNVSEMQRIHEVNVTETAPQGEMVSFTAASAPSHAVIPT
jgi:hypothetical protein